ncbi:MAG: phytanoyl-CoA dioxygenase family protein [Bacteroidetes bacterium]|jgi:phytanoyl-CoA hydroxylase|nr:phytanoyl-CoA dioxygenase family protein [Bacteroidota bacterium]
MKEFLRRFKFTYALYNFFHKNELIHNEAVYNKIGLHKKYYESVSSKDFQHLPGSNHDELKLDFKKLENCALYQQLDETDRLSLKQYDENGYAVLKQFVPESIVDEINEAIDEGLKNGRYEFVNKTKIMFAFHTLPALKKVGTDKKLMELLDVLIDGKAVLFQSINFKMGSEQHTHSDSIHMTTYPLGGLLGVWIALEDIGEDNGPLHYYPGSHKLPYYLNKDYDNEGNAWMIGNKSYDAYEEMIAQKIQENKLQQKNFYAKKGDMLLWHANLFHGGNEHTNKNKTRKSVVFHYFKEGAICYHEITQRPALIKGA